MCRVFDVGQMLGFARRMLPVRKILMLFLLALMPLQLTWAAVLGYCQDESSMMAAPAVHLAHACVDAPFARVTTPENTAPSVDLHHHHVCDHGSAWVGVFSSDSVASTWLGSSPRFSTYAARISSAPPGSIDRPKWF